MNRFILIVMALIMSAVGVFAQDIAVVPTPAEFSFEVVSFSVMVGIISFFMTQICKVFPAVENNRAVKQIVSIVFGLLFSFFIWILQLAPFMAGYEWWQTLIVGAVGGVLGSGLYTYFKPMLAKKE